MIPPLYLLIMVATAHYREIKVQHFNVINSGEICY